MSVLECVEKESVCVCSSLEGVGWMRQQEGAVGIEVCLSGFCGLITGKVSDGEYYHFYELNGAEGQEFHCLLLN